MKKNKNAAIIFILVMAVCIFLSGCGHEPSPHGVMQGLNPGNATVPIVHIKDVSPIRQLKADDLPQYDGKPYVEVNGNVPVFDEASLEQKYGNLEGNSFEEYGDLDSKGRCTEAVANLSIDTQPKGNEERGDISMIHPSGWMSDMGWERCHLIGWQLSDENANVRNLVTGTRYMNVSGMLPFENEIAWYLDTGNHVLYSVDPMFAEDELICRGVHIQAKSVEDNGEGVSFNVFCFNVAPGSTINYSTGAVSEGGETAESEVGTQKTELTYIVNTNTGKFHFPDCSSVKDMADHNKKESSESREALISQGYSPCGNCRP